jgi:hypothetical protein
MPRVLGRCAVLVLAALPWLAASADASVVTAMNTEALVRASAAIVHAEVETTTVVAGGREIETWVGLRLLESLKGAGKRGHLTLRLPGGVTGTQVSLVHGIPTFEKGERVVVFATPLRSGALTVTGLFQGKYRVISEPGAEDQVVPDAGGGAEVVGAPSASAREPLSRFLERVRALAKRHSGPTLPDGVGDELMPASAPSSEPPIFLNPIIPLRWFEPDDGLAIPLMFNADEAPSFAEGVRGGFEASLAHWTNVAGATVVLSDGGDTTQACRTFFDGSVVSHGDPCDQMPVFDETSCSGVLAITGVSGFTLETRARNGVTFLRMTEADVVFNAGIGCFLGTDRRNYEEVLSHELGHVVGLGHACGDSFSPVCATGTERDDALMRAFAHGGSRGGAPRDYDVDGARFIYPPAGFLDLQLSDDSYVVGDTLSLTTDLNGTTSADFYLLLSLPDGNFVALAPGFPLNSLVPTATNVALGYVIDAPLVAAPLTSAAALGDYAFIGILVRAGTNPNVVGNWLAFDYAPFSLSSPQAPVSPSPAAFVAGGR